MQPWFTIKETLCTKLSQQTTFVEGRMGMDVPGVKHPLYWDRGLPLPSDVRGCGRAVK